jgi:hypothetical protein
MHYTLQSRNHKVSLSLSLSLALSLSIWPLFLALAHETR